MDGRTDRQTDREMSDTEFLELSFDCWRAGEIFSGQHLDFNLSQKDIFKRFYTHIKLSYHTETHQEPNKCKTKT